MGKAICSIEGCERPRRKREWCGTHYENWRRNGDPLPGIRPIGRPRAAVVGYSSAHYRLKRDRGRAAEHPCVRCGAPAADWAYRHDDPGVERLEENGQPYSLRPEDYDPMCTRCHVTYDEIATKRVLTSVTPAR